MKELKERVSVLEEQNEQMKEKLELILDEINYLNRNAFRGYRDNIEYREY